MDEIDIWRTAKLLVDQHGISADDLARERCIDLLAQHDMEGYAAWSQILAALGELQRTERRDGEAVQ